MLTAKKAGDRNSRIQARRRRLIQATRVSWDGSAGAQAFLGHFATGFLHRLEQGGLGGVHRLGRTGEAAVQIQRQTLERRRGGDGPHGGVDPVGRRLVRHPDVEAHHGVVGDDVQRAPARNLGDVDGDAFVLTVQSVQGGRDDGGAGHRIAAFIEGAAGVSGAYHLSSSDQGQSWSAPQRLGDADARRGDLASTGGESLAAVWDRVGDGESAVFASASSNGGKTWSEAKQLSANGLNAAYPRIVAVAGSYRVLWTESTPGQPSVWKSAALP